MLGRLSRILVADENDVSRAVTHQLLHKLGYTLVDYVPDGAAAMTLIGQRSYGLVLADWETPRVDGAQILRQARRDQRLQCLPFLMVIPAWQRKFIEIVREDGATLYITRPFTQDTLSERMAQVDKDAGNLRLRAAQTASPTPRAANTLSPAGAAASEIWRSLHPDAI